MTRWHTFGGGIAIGLGASIFALGIFHLMVTGFVLACGGIAGWVGRGAFSNRGKKDGRSELPPST